MTAQLARIDGVALDPGAHWRAGANTFGGRSDQVLPFLLYAAGASHTRACEGSTEAISPKERADHNTSEPNASHGDVNQPGCPWCGVKPGRAENTKGGVSNVGTGGRTSLGEDGSRNRGAEECALSRGDRESQPHSPGAEDGRAPRQTKCDYCGFILPDTDLWSVPASCAARFPVRWNDVRLAGSQWRGEVCASSSIGATVETNREEEAISNAFRAACLRGRDERVNMRRRHRHEERDLASSADLTVAEHRPATCGGDSRTRSASMVPSRQRLELELALGERHAVERSDLAFRQLYVHGGGGVEYRDIKDREETCVVLDLEPPPTKGAEDPNCPLYRTVVRGTVSPARPARLQNNAARAIQRFWHRGQERATKPAGSPSQRSVVVSARSPSNEQAVTKLQSAFRGFHVRRALQVIYFGRTCTQHVMRKCCHRVDGNSYLNIKSMCMPWVETTRRYNSSLSKIFFALLKTLNALRYCHAHRPLLQRPGNPPGIRWRVLSLACTRCNYKRCSPNVGHCSAVSVQSLPMEPSG